MERSEYEYECEYEYEYDEDDTRRVALDSANLVLVLVLEPKTDLPPGRVLSRNEAVGSAFDTAYPRA